MRVKYETHAFALPQSECRVRNGLRSCGRGVKLRPMNHTFWIWRWGRKKTAGRPLKIVEACTRARQAPAEETEWIVSKIPHPALCSFDARALKAALSETVASGARLLLARRPRKGQAIYAVLEAERDSSLLRWVRDELGDLAVSLGLVAYDFQAARLLEPCRPKSFAFEVENRPVRYEPTLKEVRAGMQHLALHGSTFAVLENHRGSFVQTTGVRGAFTVERRDLSGGGFRHFVAGRKEAQPEQHNIVTAAGEFTVFANEVLDLADARDLFVAFQRGRGRGRVYRWREITDLFG